MAKDKAKYKLPHLEDYLVELTNNNYSLETIKNYKRDLEIFSGFLKTKGIKFSNISKKSISIYKGFLKSSKYYEFLEDVNGDARDGRDMAKTLPKGSRSGETNKGALSARSINRMLSALRSYLRFLIDFDFKSPLAPDAIKMIKTKTGTSQVAEFEDLVRLVEFPSEFEKSEIVKKRNRAILELLFSTGMRISELVSLNLEHLDFKKESLKIRKGKIFITGKGKKQRFVYLTERCKVHLEEYLKMRDDDFKALFIPTRGPRLGNKDSDRENVRISARYIQSRIAKYRKLLGIVVPTTPHSLRHGFATYLAEQGASPAAIQRLLGHESLQTTTRYVHASDRFAEKTHKKFHPLKK